MEVAAEEGHAPRVIEQGVRLDGRGADRHPAAVGRGRRAAAGARLGALQPRRDPGAQRHDARHAPHDADDRHARPEDTKRYIHHYNFPPYSTGETGRVGLAAPPRDRARRARRARPDPGGAPRGRVPVCAAARERRDRLQRLDVDGERVRLDPVDDGRRRAAQGAGRRHRDGHDRRRRQVRDADRHPRRRGRPRRHGLQGRRHRGVRHGDPARHEGRRAAGRGARRGLCSRRRKRV